MNLTKIVNIASLLLSSICAIVSLVIFYVIYKGGIIPTTMQPFDLKDRTISKPYLQNTVGSYTNLAICAFFTLGMGLVWSYFALRKRGLKLNKHWPFIVYTFALIFYGHVITNLITAVIKSYRGGLRPHFLAQCKPNQTLVDTLAREKSTTWVDSELSKIICTNTDKPDYRWSFPSGHSSESMYGMFLSTLLVQSISWNIQLDLVKSSLQMMYMTLGVWICVTRLVDFHHFWWDVLAGGLLGCGVAWCTVYWFLLPAENRVLGAKLKVCDIGQGSSGEGDKRNGTESEWL